MDKSIKESVVYTLERLEEGVEFDASARALVQQAKLLYFLLYFAAIQEEREYMLDGPFGIGN